MQPAYFIFPSEATRLLPHSQSESFSTSSLTMATPKAEAPGAQHFDDVPVMDEKQATGNVVQVNAASVALAAAVAAQKPKLLSKNMLKLYFIMGVGYLVSTMNGFGPFRLLCQSFHR
jgi:hypothetical protein